MKNLLTVLAVLFALTAHAQYKAVWKGGTPGSEAEWNEAGNWSNNSVPDQYTRVIIRLTNSGHHSMPVITSEVTAASIELHKHATLTIDHGGSLTIDGADLYSEGIINYGGSLINNGMVVYHNLFDTNTQNLLQDTKGTGLVYCNGVLINSPVLAHH